MRRRVRVSVPQILFVHVFAGSRWEGVAVDARVHVGLREWHTGDFHFPQS